MFYWSVVHNSGAAGRRRLRQLSCIQTGCEGFTRFSLSTTPDASANLCQYDTGYPHVKPWSWIFWLDTLDSRYSPDYYKFL
jgi:hypothetical protein